MKHLLRSKPLNERYRLIASVDERRSDAGLLEYKAVLHHRDIVEEMPTQTRRD